jgi:hypothetical protein
MTRTIVIDATTATEELESPSYSVTADDGAGHKTTGASHRAYLRIAQGGLNQANGGDQPTGVAY